MSWAAACSSSLSKQQQGLRNEAEAFGWLAVSSVWNQMCFLPQ
jgi:hypothetical protein